MMPKYRQLHTKIVDSFDFNDMPNDFCRLVWVLLPIAVDSEGRGLNNPSWLRSKIFPLREDVETSQVGEAMRWLIAREMLVAYEVGGKKYFYIPSWSKYQTGTEKEASSSIPTPELVWSNYGVTPEEVESNSGVGPAQLRVNTTNTTTTNTTDNQPTKTGQTQDFLKGQVIWDALKNNLKAECSKALYALHIKDAEFFGIDGTTMFIQANNEKSVQWLQALSLDRTLRGLSSDNFEHIHFMVCAEVEA